MCRCLEASKLIKVLGYDVQGGKIFPIYLGGSHITFQNMDIRSDIKITGMIWRYVSHTNFHVLRATILTSISQWWKFLFLPKISFQKNGMIISGDFLKCVIKYIYFIIMDKKYNTMFS